MPNLDQNNPEFCEYCSNGMAADCPYWSRDRNGKWVHDRSGVVGYDENVIQEDTYGVWGQLPKTPDPSLDSDKKRGRDDDDDDRPGRFSIFPRRRR
jgi:hypothetical protein